MVPYPPRRNQTASMDGSRSASFRSAARSASVPDEVPRPAAAELARDRLPAQRARRAPSRGPRRPPGAARPRRPAPRACRAAARGGGSSRHLPGRAPPCARNSQRERRRAPRRPRTAPPAPRARAPRRPTTGPSTRASAESDCDAARMRPWSAGAALVRDHRRHGGRGGAPARSRTRRRRAHQRQRGRQRHERHRDAPSAPAPAAPARRSPMRFTSGATISPCAIAATRPMAANP